MLFLAKNQPLPAKSRAIYVMRLFHALSRVFHALETRAVRDGVPFLGFFHLTTIFV